MKQFIRRLLGFSLGPILGAVLSFVQIPIMTNLLSKAEYGRAGLFRNLLTEIPNFIYVGFDQAYTREYHRADDKRRILQQSIFFPLVIGVLLLLGSSFFAKPLSYWLFKDEGFSYIIWIAGVWVLATIVERFLLLNIRMEEKALEYSRYTLLLKFLVFIVSVALVLLGVRDFRAVVFGMLFGQLLGDAWLFYKYRTFMNFRGFKADWPLMAQLFRFGFPLMLAVSLTSLLNSLDNIFLNQFSTADDLGTYNATRNIVNVIGVLKTSFASFWIPTAYRWYEENKPIKHYKYISDAVLFVLTGLFFGLLIFKKVIIMILGSKYYDAGFIIGLLSFPHIMYTLSETTTLGIVFSRKTYLNIAVSLLAIIPSLVINYTMTPTWGYRGAATASCIAYVMFYLARTYFSNRSGFGFSQHKQVISILLMLIASSINAFDIAHVEWITLGIGLVTLVVQSSTIMTTLSIRNNPTEWDFS